MVNKRIQRELEELLAGKGPDEQKNTPTATGQHQHQQQPMAPTGLDGILNGAQKALNFALCLDLSVGWLGYRYSPGYRNDLPALRKEAAKSYLTAGVSRTFYNLLVAGGGATSLIAGVQGDGFPAVITAAATAFFFHIASAMYRDSSLRQ